MVSGQKGLEEDRTLQDPEELKVKRESSRRGFVEMLNTNNKRLQIDRIIS